MKTYFKDLIKILLLTIILILGLFYADWSKAADRETKFSLDLGIAYNHTPSVSLQGDNPVAVLRLRAKRDDWFIEYQHQSSIPDGPPFNNNRDERWSEQIGIFYNYQFN